jgi:hypothetical protein
MTRSNIALTEGGGAKKTATVERTIGGVVVQSQSVVAEDSDLPTYNACASAISVATTADHVVQLMAPAGAYVRIHRISIEQVASAGTAALQTFNLYRLSSAGTGGSAITPRPFDASDTAGATAMSLPTAKGTEGVLLMSTVLVLRQALLATSSQMDDYWEWRQTPGKKPIIIPSGTTNGVAIKIGTGTASATVTVNIEFTETAWL